MANSESIDKSLLQTFVPVNALSGDHLDRLLEQQEVVHYRQGEVLFSKGESDNHTVYVLKGEVELDQGDGNCQLILAGGVESWHPLIISSRAGVPQRRKLMSVWCVSAAPAWIPFWPGTSPPVMSFSISTPMLPIRTTGTG